MADLGVRPGDIEDSCQEVFLVVHAKLGDFHGGSIRAWLFAIAARVASDHRKRAFVRREVTDEDVPDIPVPEAQTGAIERAEALALLDTILASLDDDKRAVFMLFELEQLPMQEVAYGDPSLKKPGSTWSSSTDTGFCFILASLYCFEQ